MALGAPMIAARFPRAYLDVNREPYELDPELFGGRLPDFANRNPRAWSAASAPSPGSSPNGEEIYPPGGCRSESRCERIEQLYMPFHEALAVADRGDAQALRHGRSHRLPFDAVGVDGHARAGGARISCSATASARPAMPSLTRFLKDAITGLGYDVHLNRPYAGGYITEHYGKPTLGVHIHTARDQSRSLPERTQDDRHRRLITNSSEISLY